MFGCRAVAVIAVLCGGAILQIASAQSVPFAAFLGRWSGSGTIRVKNADKQTTERIRCSATYWVPGSQNLNLQLGCRSDSYTFDLTGEFEVDAGAYYRPLDRTQPQRRRHRQWFGYYPARKAARLDPIEALRYE